MKLGKRQQEVMNSIQHQGYWCYGLGRGSDDSSTQRVCESLEKKGLLESYERQHPYGFSLTTAWRIPQPVPEAAG